MPEQLFEPDQVARALGMSASGLRKLSTELSAYLSESAQGRAGGTGRAQRRYSEQDLLTLRQAREWLASGVSYAEVRRWLSEIRPPGAGGTVEPPPAPPRAETTPEPPPVGGSAELVALDSLRLANAALRRLVDTQDTLIEMQRTEIERLRAELDQVRAAPPPAPATGESVPPPAPPSPTPSPEPPVAGGAQSESLSTLPAPGEQPTTSATAPTVEPSTKLRDRIGRALRALRGY